MASMECNPIMGVWRQSPQWGLGQSPWSGSQPPEAKSFLRIRHPKEGANWPHVCVLNERNCNLEKGPYGEGKETIWVLQKLQI